MSDCPSDFAELIKQRILGDSTHRSYANGWYDTWINIVAFLEKCEKNNNISGIIPIPRVAWGHEDEIARQMNDFCNLILKDLGIVTANSYNYHNREHIQLTFTRHPRQ